MARPDWKRAYTAPVAFTAVGALVATAAVLYPGLQTAEMDLHDGGIWVTYEDGGYVGHLNYPSRTLDGGLKPPFEDARLHQQDAVAVMLDPASGALASIDPAAMAVGDQVMMPATTGFALGGGSVSASDPDEGAVFAGTAVPTVQVPAEEPLYEGEGFVASTTSLAGEVFVADLHEDTVHRFAPPGQPGGAFEASGVERLDGLDGMGEPTVTAVGDMPVVVDAEAGRLAWPGGSIRDDRLVGAVPQPTGPEATGLALATTRELLTVDLGAGTVTALPIVAPGDPGAGASRPGGTAGPARATAPVRVAGCTHAASSATGYYLRDCAGDQDDEVLPLEGMEPGAELVFRVNRDTVVLNDTGAGTTWMVLEQMKVVANWEDLEPPKGEGEEEDEDSEEVTRETALPERDEENRAPVAVDDSFGVRPGKTTQLPVLANDSDPDGDLLTARLEGGQPGLGTVQPILDGVGLQVVVPAAASGTATVAYVADDGRGGTDAATLSLRVVPDERNGAPVQQRVPVLQVPAGRSVSAEVLGDWLDPDGDDLQLTGAVAESPDSVRTRPDGQLVFQDNTGEPGTREVQLTVSDGRESATGTVRVEVLDRGEVRPPVTVADHVTVRSGEDATLRPLDNDDDPLGGELRLAYVGTVPEAEVSYSSVAGTLNVTGGTPGTHYLEYVAANEFDSAPGLVRVDVLEEDAEAGLPVAVRDTALLPAGGDTLVNVLGNDTDPAGGMLVVQGVEDVRGPDGGPAPITVAVEDFHHVRIVDSGGLARPVTFTYRVANAEGTSTGEVTVVPLPAPETLQPPVATADTAVVRAGDIATVDVLANDGHPDDAGIELEAELVEGPAEGRGTAFVSDGRLRFRAGDEAGRVRVTYQVRGPDGQRASAPVEFTVTPMDRAANNPPVPPSVEARVLAGDAVTVPVRLAGTDPDGDSVRLVGVQSPPGQGSVRLEEGRLVYEAMDAASGTDTFTYQVMDRLGATATGTVSVGIARPLSVNHPPVALDEEVRVRPGRTFTTTVLANDADPDGDPVALVRDGFASSAEEGTAVEIVDGRLRVTAPEAEGHVNLQYTVADPAGATDTGVLAITVDEQAPLMPPVARDDVVGAEEIAGRDQVSVAVLDNDEDPDGAVQDLGITLDEAAVAAGARVDGDRVVVPVAQDGQTLMYTVEDIDGGTGHGFILVPGDDARAPWLTTAAPLEVMAGETLAVGLRDHVGVREGRSPRLTDEDAATAAPASSRLEVRSATEVGFTADPGYSGRATVNVTVTDGEGGGDPNGLVSTLSIPVTVTPRPEDNAPPTVQSSGVEIEQGGDPVEVDLGPLARDPDGDDLAFALGTVRGEFGADLEGTTLTVTPSSNAERGTSGTVPFAVSDGGSAPVAGEITVRVVGTSRPLPRAVADEVPDARAGTPVTVDVLANDVNPFAGEGELTVVAADVTTGAGTAGTDGSTVSITPDADYSGRMQVTYAIEDLTGDPARRAEGTVTVVVEGAPDAPGVPRIEGVDDGEVSLSWAAPPDNGAPITGYTVTDTSTGATRQCAATACTVTGLANAVEHRFSVTATNAVGESDPSGTSAPAVPDVRPGMPAAPVVAAGDGVVDLDWTAPENRGSAITGYRVQVSPALTGGGTRTTGAGASLRWDGLRNGVPYRFRIQASNRAEEPSEWSPWSADVTPAGRPFAPGTPTAVRDESVVDGGVVRVSWSAADDNGAALTGYTVTAYAGGRAVATRTVAPGTTSVGWSGLDTSTAYAFSVSATNAEGDSPSSGRSSAVTPFGLPGAVSGVTARATGTDRQLRLSFDGAAANGSAVTYQYAVSGGAWQPLGRSTAATVTVPANGSSYRLSVRAVNDAGPGPTASVSSEPAYGPFRMPAITATAQEGGARFTWSPTSAAAVGNGRPVAITPRVNAQVVDNDGEYTTDRFREAREFTMSIRVCAEGTEDCETATRAVTSQPIPDPTATVGVGARYPADSCTENGGPDAEFTNCWYTTMAFTGMEPGPLQVACTPRGSATSSRPGEVYTYKTGTVTIGADGTYSGTPEFCILHDGFADFRLTLPELGMESNVIHGPWP